MFIFWSAQFVYIDSDYGYIRFKGYRLWFYDIIKNGDVNDVEFVGENQTVTIDSVFNTFNEGRHVAEWL